VVGTIPPFSLRETQLNEVSGITRFILQSFFPLFLGPGGGLFFLFFSLETRYPLDSSNRTLCPLSRCSGPPLPFSFEFRTTLISPLHSVFFAPFPAVFFQGALTLNLSLPSWLSLHRVTFFKDPLMVAPAIDFLYFKIVFSTHWSKRRTSFPKTPPQPLLSLQDLPLHSKSRGSESLGVFPLVALRTTSPLSLLRRLCPFFFFSQRKIFISCPPPRKMKQQGP